ncbi:glycosyltransferase, partial [Campylobacter avium]|uniref:glycosyltransferase n=1 Tax=Campylobacter avium TaxID=522485 RepID=UPI00255BBFCC
KENAGLGAAYNTGLDIAKGDYIGFVESDDFIESNMYEELYERAVQTGVDLVKCNFYDYDSQNKIDKKRENFEKLALKHKG